MDQCIECNSILHSKKVVTDITESGWGRATTITSVTIPYCLNETCSRYGLLTAVMRGKEAAKEE